MATIALPTNAVRKRVETGVVAAGQDLANVTTGAADTLEVCELPRGAVVTDVLVQADIALGLAELGISGPDITDDPNFFRAVGTHSADDVFRADLRLGYKAETDGEKITLTTANAITGATGRVWAEYTMDADVV